MANFSMPDYMVTLGFVVLLGFFFAKLEIAIEGDAGWAANLPTWRIEKHWLLDLFWGGREMTGYHAWAFSLIALFFHFPLIFSSDFSWAAEQRALASIMLFWVSEDFLWFVLNPAFGLRRFEKLTPAGTVTGGWVHRLSTGFLHRWACGGCIRRTNKCAVS